MKKKKKNGKIIVLLSVLVLVCLYSFFYVINNYEKIKEEFPKDDSLVIDKEENQDKTVADVNNNQDEVNLGMIVEDSGGVGGGGGYCSVTDNCSTCGNNYNCSYEETKDSFSGGNCKTTCDTSVKDGKSVNCNASSCVKCTVTNANSTGTMGIKYTYNIKKSSTRYCSKCKAGYYLSGGKCVECPAGSYCSGTSTVDKCDKGQSSPKGSSSSKACTDCAAGTYNGVAGGTCNTCDVGTISAKGASKCTECKEGYWTNLADRTKCEEITISILKSSAWNDHKYLAKGETMAVKHIFQVQSIKDLLKVNWSIKGQGSYSTTSISPKNDSYTQATVKGKTGNAQYSCDAYTIQATYSPKGLKEKTATSTQDVCVFKCAWQSFPYSNRYYPEALGPSKSISEIMSDCTFYEGGYISDATYGEVWKLSKIWNRCCETPRVPPTTVGHCYGTKEFLGMEDNKVKWALKPSGDYKYMYSNIKSSDKCALIDVPSTCEAKNININKKNTSATTCEQNGISFNLTDGMKCNKFYDIKCNTNVSVDFDYGDDGSTKTSNTLLAGQGFKFAIKTTTSKTCSFEFFADKWKQEYSLAVQRFNTITNSKITALLKKKLTNETINEIKKLLQNKNKNDAKRVFELARDVLDLEQIVTDYNNYKPASSSDGAGTIDFSYKLNSGKDVKIDNYKLIKAVANEGEGKTFANPDEKTDKNGVYNLGVTSPITGKKIVNPVKKIWSNNIKSGKMKNENPRVIKYVPDATYFDISTGNKTTTKENNVYGGYRIYTDPNISSDFTGIKTPISVKLTNLGSTGSSVTNTKCTIKIQKANMLYRPIDVTNPWVDASRNKPLNWLNKTYNFTKTIQGTIWSESPLYVVPLSKTDIVALKKSNDSTKNKNLDANVYLGNCHKSPKLQDAITRKICSMITK